jgi:putative ABC transport system permease protein
LTERTTLEIALSGLGRYPLRTALSLLGLAIGVATVLVTVAVGNGATGSIQSQIRAAGLNVIVVKAGNYRTKREGPSDVLAPHASAASRRDRHESHPKWVRLFVPVVLAHPENDPMEKHDHPTAAERLGDSEAGLGAAATLTQEDAEAIASLPGVAHVAPGIHENAKLFHGERRWFTRLHGTDVDLPLIRRSHALAEGRFFGSGELRRAEPVVVLGSVVREKLFGPGVDPVGADVTLWNQRFRVVGVTASANWLTPGAPGDDEFDAVYVPFTTIHRLLNVTNLNTITVTAESTGEVSKVAQAVTDLLRARHGIAESAPDDFTVTTQASEVLTKGLHPSAARVLEGNLGNLEQVTLEELSITLERSSRTMKALLAALAGVALLVGGIGIGNVMLLAVTERTREIGVRLAVGARARDVGAQFFAEALALGVTGGLAGVLVGIGAATAVTRYFGWSTDISFGVVALALGIALAVGLVAGFFPARRAARLDPIDCLRYE